MLLHTFAVISILIFVSCVSLNKPKPVPEDKKEFIGLWVSQSGFKLLIKPEGTADLTQINKTENFESKMLDAGVTPEYALNMLVEFRGDSTLIVTQPFVRGKEYKISRLPFMDGDTCKMILNGVTLAKY